MAADYGILSNIWASRPETILRASNLGPSDAFGKPVAISGNYVIIGASNEDGSSTDVSFNSGAAYIFELSGGIWSEKTILRASNLGTVDNFGQSVAISGNYAIVGANQEDESSTDVSFNSGAAYIFERDGSGNWIQNPTILRASNLDLNDQFGYSVAISGNYAIVGAYFEDGSSNQASACGAAYIFERDGSGNWIENPTILRASNLEAGDNFGGSVAISGNYAIVGGRLEDGSSNQASACGAAYIFERDGSGNWIQNPTILRASNLSASDLFGVSVAIDGNYAIVGATQEDGSSTVASFNNGAAYIFERDGSGNWIENPTILRASNLDAGDNFGQSVAISGNYAIVSAHLEDGTTVSIGFNSGAAYIFERNGSGIWTEKTMLRASNLGTGDQFGQSVAISEKYVIVGANNEDGSSNNITDCGAAYIYTLPGINPTPLSFVNNTLTIANNINATDTDPVSFSLASGAKLFPFRVTNFSGTGTVTYTLDISGGANVVSGTFSSANFDILQGSVLTAAVATTYKFTLTANAAITYTIVGSLLTSPTNIISTPSSINELKPIGTTIGTLTCDNPNNEFITYSVSDTANFSITGSTLKTNTIFDFESVPSYTITITASIGGLTSSNTIIVSVTNISAEATELRNQNLQGLALQTAVASQSNPPITAADLKAAGYTATELISAGFLPNWNIDASANYFMQSYVNDFIDISGHLLIRDNGALVVGGDVSLNAVSVTGSTLFTNDMLLKSRLFLGGDISANGKLYVGGDLSVNGLFNGGFAAGTIPSTAVIGYTTGSVAGDIAITGNVLIAGDASFNGTTVGLGTNTVLKVGGRLDLSDGSFMTTYDDNILSGSYVNGNVVFKDSRFSSVTVVGAATVVGSITSTSDYRIKTNVMELGETDNVDHVIPIQYNNTLTNSHEYGVLAHELQAVYPDLVKGEKDGDEYQRVYYNGLIGVLVKEVQALKRRLAALE